MPSRCNPLKVAFLGPEGTFTEEALLAFLDGKEAILLSRATVLDCVKDVADGVTDRAVVPIENSSEGSVGATLDALVFESEDVTIFGEIVQPIQQCLITRSKIPLGEIKRVLSHPQALAQSSYFLRDRLPQAELVATSSTAAAVKQVSETDESSAAIANARAAALYGCSILATGIEDVKSNNTRFIVLAAADTKAPDHTGLWKTSIAFWDMPNDPGALASVLQEFGRRGLNLSKIESRPRKQGLGSYIFFADIEGCDRDDAVAKSIEATSKLAGSLRVLGCYPMFITT